jgi:hypothetical protein
LPRAGYGNNDAALPLLVGAEVSRRAFRAPVTKGDGWVFFAVRAAPTKAARRSRKIATQSGTQAKRPPEKTNPGKALAEAKQPNRLSALGTPYPDGG